MTATVPTMAFVAVALAATFSPGPGVMLAISTALESGVRRTLYSSAGNAMGVFIVASIAVSGVGLLVRQSPLAFTAVKLAGAMYLVYLGMRQWLAAKAPVTAGAQVADGDGAAFRRGLLVALSNPKGILFFTAVFPQFMPAGEAALPRFLLLMLIFLPCVFVSHGSYVLLTRMLGKGMRGRTMTWARRAGGAAFVLIGAAMLGLSA
jgi:homoserine/homoserine lactone efflux protein